MFCLSRQALYQSWQRSQRRYAQLAQVKPLVLAQRCRLPRLGTRKLYFLLKGELDHLGIKLGRDGLFDYLRKEHLLVKPRKSYTRTTWSKHWLRKHPNVAKDLVLERSEQLFVSDITYVKSKEKTHYLSLVTDAFSRKIMGYHLSDDLSSESVAKALKMAVCKRKTTLPLTHHSDRGLQYCSDYYQQLLKQYQVRPSMTDGYDCYQNALAERINGIIKEEFLIYQCNTKRELQTLIKESIETYNQRRPHLSLKMKTPDQVHEKTCENCPTGLLSLS